MISIANTVGLEIEVNNIPLNDAKAHCPQGWHVDDDNSCRQDRYQLGDLVLANDPPPQLARMGRCKRVRFGAEFVSPPVNLDDGWRELMKDVMRVLRLAGAYNESVSDRTALHVHVYAGTPSVRVLRNLIWLWQGLEAPFYRLSVGEHSYHRGAVHNDYMYCRPLSAPQIIKDYEGLYYWAFDIEKLMRYAKTLDDFLKGWCRADYQPTKWLPFRYYGVNIGNLANMRQTIEFRTYNQTMKPRIIRAWVELSVALVQMAFMDRAVSHLPKFPLGCDKPDDGSVFTFGSVSDIIPPSLISDESWETLAEIWETSSWQPGCLPQVNHLVRKHGKVVDFSAIPTILRPEQVPAEVWQEAWDRDRDE